VNYNNKQYDISSSVFILSMGAIENARFLLNHEEISQQHEMLGKCFMEHLNIKLGEYILNDIDDVKRSYYTADHLSIDNKIGKSNLSFQSVKQIKSYGRTAKIKTFFKKLACDMSIEDKVQFIADFECPGTGVITTLTEQSPNKNSAVTLSEEKDNLGLKKAVINWEISATDLKTINKMAIELAKSFADSDLGLVKLEEYILDQTKPFDISPHAHHMGSTRMASSIEHGVVDKDCKVFGTENLYIAGSSIFATAGACNPTMPIIQFGLRLVDHLKNKQLSA